MRVDHIFPISTHWNVTQLYISCAHVEIQGPGGGMFFSRIRGAAGLDANMLC